METINYSAFRARLAGALDKVNEVPGNGLADGQPEQCGPPD